MSSSTAINGNGVYPTLSKASAPTTEASTTSVPSPTSSTTSSSSASTISSSTASSSSSWFSVSFSNLWNNSSASAPVAQAPAAAPATSTFRTALPYAIGSLALGTAGVIVAVTSLSTAAQIVGVVAAVVGIWASLGTIGCGLYYHGDPEGFKANWSKVVAVSIYHGAVTVLDQVITQVIWRLVDRFLKRP